MQERRIKMGIPCSLDPLGSVNSEPFKRGEVIALIDNPQLAGQQSLEVDLPKPGVIKVYLIGGGNRGQYCWIGCQYAGSAAGFIGKLYFNTKCHLKLTVGGTNTTNVAPGFASMLQVAPWGNKSQWGGLITCNAGRGPEGAHGKGGTIGVNRDSSFNTYFDIELERNGNGGRNEGFGYSVWNGYGSGSKNGYGKLIYERSRP